MRKWGGEENWPTTPDQKTNPPPVNLANPTTYNTFFLLTKWNYRADLWNPLTRRILPSCGGGNEWRRWTVGALAKGYWEWDQETLLAVVLMVAMSDHGSYRARVKRCWRVKGRKFDIRGHLRLERKLQENLFIFLKLKILKRKWFWF